MQKSSEEISIDLLEIIIKVLIEQRIEYRS